MGIKDLKKFIRERYPELIATVHLGEFASEKISIDIASYIYKYKVVFGDYWLSPFVNFMISLRRNNVHGIFIFDGVAPKDKGKEREKRKKQKDSLEDTITNLTYDFDTYLRTGEISEYLQKTYDTKIVTSNIKKVDRLLNVPSKSAN